MDAAIAPVYRLVGVVPEGQDHGQMYKEKNSFSSSGGSNNSSGLGINLNNISMSS